MDVAVGSTDKPPPALAEYGGGGTVGVLSGPPVGELSEPPRDRGVAGLDTSTVGGDDSELTS